MWLSLFSGVRGRRAHCAHGGSAPRPPAARLLAQRQKQSATTALGMVALRRRLGRTTRCLPAVGPRALAHQRHKAARAAAAGR